MSEINFDPSSRSFAVDKASNGRATHKNANLNNVSPGSDSAEFSHPPDLAAIEQQVENDFAQLRSDLEDSVNSVAYPPLETIDRLAAMLGVDLQAQDDESLA